MRAAAKLLLAAAFFACADAPAADRARPGEPADPGDTAAAGASAPADSSAIAEADSGWTTGRLQGAAGAGSAVLSAVRTARQEGYDRAVFEFGDGLLPGYRVEFVDSPQYQCGSGDEVRLPGDAWIQVELEPAQAHDEEGRATVTDRRQTPGLPNLVELRAICDFEAQVTWVLGLRTASPFRVLRLRDPARLVLDIRH